MILKKKLIEMTNIPLILMQFQLKMHFRKSNDGYYEVQCLRYDLLTLCQFYVKTLTKIV